MIFDPLVFFKQSFFIIAALVAVFVTGILVGLIAGLIIGNTAIADAIQELIATYQYAIDEELGLESY